MTELKPARLRVAPSPTGDPHVGTAYMSLFNLAYARKTGGQFVLRIEDTDRARYVADSEQQIFDTLKWLGLPWDEGPDVGGPYAPYRQSERLDTYRPFVDKLIEDGHAYYCWCSPERLATMREVQAKAKMPTGYDRMCYGKTKEERAKLPGFQETPVVRMLIPDDVPLTFDDVIRGKINAPRPDDQVILKTDGFPTYHMAVVVDDHLMGITHVVRGEEWISSTPKHLLLYRWLGLEPPKYAHMPLLRNQDKSKISKRKNPAARLTWFAEAGFLPEALRNFLQLLAYPPVDDEHEVSTFADFVEHFDWSKVNTVGPIFDMKKLEWLNGHYIRSISQEDLANRICEYLIASGARKELNDSERDLIYRATPLIQERMVTLAEAWPLLSFLFVADSELEISEDGAKQLKANAKEVLAAAIEVVAALDDFDHQNIHEALKAKLVEEIGIKPRLAFTPLRVAITGQRVSPPLFESMELLGKESCVLRLRKLHDSL